MGATARKTDEDTASSTTEVTSNEEMTQAHAVSDSLAAPVAMEPTRRTAKGSILLLFSGLHGIEGSLKQQFESGGFIVVDFDIANGPHCNIADDFIWDPLLTRIEAGEFSALIAAPPCGTFSRVRRLPGGPPPLRGRVGADRYGLKGLRPQDAETVRVHNLLAIRTAQAAQTMIRQRRIVVVEQPAASEGEISMLHLDEFLILLESCQHTKAVQCPFGAASSKKTSWITSGVDFSSMISACPHAARPWYEAGSGAVMSQPHPPARGRTRYFKTFAEAIASVNPRAGYNTTELAYYTPLLNKYIALKVKLALSKRKHTLGQQINKLETARDQRQSDWNERLGKEHVRFSQPLRGCPAVDLKQVADAQAIGGLRDAAKSLRRLTTSAAFGRTLGDKLKSAVVADLSVHAKAGTTGQSWVAQMCSKIGSADAEPAPPEAVKCFRKIIVQMTAHDDSKEREHAPGCTTDVDARLLESWRKAAFDPDDAVCQWLLNGAPAGITHGSSATKLFFIYVFKIYLLSCLRSPFGR